MKHIQKLENFMDSINEASYTYKEGLTFINSLKKLLASSDINVEGPNNYLHPKRKTKSKGSWMTYWITVTDNEMRDRMGIIADTDGKKPFYRILVYDKSKFDSHSHDIKETVEKGKAKDVVKFIKDKLK